MLRISGQIHDAFLSFGRIQHVKLIMELGWRSFLSTMCAQISAKSRCWIRFTGSASRIQIWVGDRSLIIQTWVCKP